MMRNRYQDSLPTRDIRAMSSAVVIDTRSSQSIIGCLTSSYLPVSNNERCHLAAMGSYFGLPMERKDPASMRTAMTGGRVLPTRGCMLFALEGDSGYIFVSLHGTELSILLLHRYQSSKLL